MNPKNKDFQSKLRSYPNNNKYGYTLKDVDEVLKMPIAAIKSKYTAEQLGVLCTICGMCPSNKYAGCSISIAEHAKDSDKVDIFGDSKTNRWIHPR